MGTNDLAYHQSELARAMFKARVRRRDKSPPERAADLERLVRLAFPRAQSDLQDTLANTRISLKMHFLMMKVTYVSDTEDRKVSKVHLD